MLASKIRIGVKIGTALLALPLLMASEAWVWTDANGVQNYSQQAPPPGVKAERIRFDEGGATVRVQAPPASSPEATTPTQQNLTPEQQSMLENLKRAEDARQAEVARIREANCVKAREVLERLSVTGRIRVRDESGEERAMSEEERQARIAEAQQAIVVNCEAQPVS